MDNIARYFNYCGCYYIVRISSGFFGWELVEGLFGLYCFVMYACIALFYYDCIVIVIGVLLFL